MFVPPARLRRWVENFERSHGTARLRVADGALVGEAPDGSWFEARPPFGRRYVGPPQVSDLLEGVLPPDHWGVLLVRRGGFALARLSRGSVSERKVGRRHVQGRTKAGGQSQLRFARRREQQARESYEAAAGHARRILRGRLVVLVTGGDRAGIDAVLREAGLDGLNRDPHVLAVPDPRGEVLERAIEDACSVRMKVHNA